MQALDLTGEEGLPVVLPRAAVPDALDGPAHLGAVGVDA
jgi:hypothetical protein